MKVSGKINEQLNNLTEIVCGIENKSLPLTCELRISISVWRRSTVIIAWKSKNSKNTKKWQHNRHIKIEISLFTNITVNIVQYMFVTKIWTNGAFWFQRLFYGKFAKCKSSITTTVFVVNESNKQGFAYQPHSCRVAIEEGSAATFLRAEIA